MSSQFTRVEKQFLDAMALHYEFRGDTQAAFLARFDRKNISVNNEHVASKVTWNKDQSTPNQKLQTELSKICDVISKDSGPIQKRRGRRPKGQSPWEQVYDWLWKVKFPDWEKEALKNEIPNSYERSKVDVLKNERSARLRTLYQESREWCIERFRIVVHNREEAAELADDISLGAPPTELQACIGEVIFLVGELGTGKTLIAQRLFQSALQQAISDENSPIPIYLEPEQWRQRRPLRDAIETASLGLGDPSAQGGIIFLDGLDEVDSRLAIQIVGEARRLAALWKNTRIIITTRPIRILDELDMQVKITVPPLTEEKICALLERISGRSVNISIASDWTESIRDAVQRPLFALILAMHLRQRIAEVPRSLGELLFWLVNTALMYARADFNTCGSLLKRLATLSIESGGIWVRAADVAPTPNALQPLLDSGLVIERSRGMIAFPLPILTEWFAAQSLGDNPSIVEELINDPERLERWRYPLTIAISSFGHDLVCELLIPIAERYPAFTAEIIRKGLIEWSTGEVPLLSFQQCGQQIRTVMQAWVRGLGVLATLIAPLRSDGTVQPLGVRIQDSFLEIAWYQGNNKLANVVALQRSWMNFDSPERQQWNNFRGSRPGYESAWAWRFTLNILIGNIERALKFPILEVESEPLICEAAWWVALAIVRYRYLRSSNTLNILQLSIIPLSELEEILIPLEKQAQRNYFTILPRLHEEIQGPYLKQLRRRINYLKEIGEVNLRNPWFEPDRKQGRYIWNQFSSEQLLIRAKAVYKGALDAYLQLVQTWFTTLRPGMKIAATLPARLVGLIRASALSDGSYDRPPYILWFLEALPEDRENEVEIAIGENDAFKSWQERMGLASKSLNQLRPQTAMWIRGTPTGGGSLPREFFQATPVTAFVYSWLREDLQGIFGFDCLSHRTRFE